MTKTFAYLSIVLTAVAMTTPSMAADEHNVVPGLTAAGAPLGLHGVDPVAFLELGNRLDGKAKYTAIYDDVAYYFTSAENMDAFNRNPARFVPQNGGFCTYGVSVGKKFDGNPRFSAVVDGKLYVFLSEEIMRAFNKDRAGTIAKAKTNWTQIQHAKATDL